MVRTRSGFHRKTGIGIKIRIELYLISDVFKRRAYTE